MTEQLDPTEAPPAALSAWIWARAQYPDKKLARVIDLKLQKQAFVVLDEDRGLQVDGSTHFIHAPAGSLSPAEEAATIAEYDSAWRDWRPAA